MTIKITKREYIRKQRNDMDNVDWVLVHGKIINDQKTRAKRFKFVISYSMGDVAEYLNRDTWTDKDIREYQNSLADGYTSLIKSFDDVVEFWDACNQSISQYNNFIHKIY